MLQRAKSAAVVQLPSIGHVGPKWGKRFVPTGDTAGKPASFDRWQPSMQCNGKIGWRHNTGNSTGDHCQRPTDNRSLKTPSLGFSCFLQACLSYSATMASISADGVQ